MATEWHPLSEVHDKSVTESPVTDHLYTFYGSSPYTKPSRETIQAKLDVLWGKFLSSSLSEPQNCCNCKKVSGDFQYQEQQRSPSREEGTFKPLDGQQSTGLSLSEALAVLCPHFIKQSQLRRRKVSVSVRRNKFKKTPVSEEEKERRRKIEATQNRLRVKNFQKEVLNQLQKKD